MFIIVYYYEATIVIFMAKPRANQAAQWVESPRAWPENLELTLEMVPRLGHFFSTISGGYDGFIVCISDFWWN